MAKLYQLDDLVARLPVDRRSLKTALEGSIKVGVDEIWMGRRGERGRGQHVIIPICLYHTHLSSFFFSNAWQMSVVRWYQSLYDMSRLKSILLQCYALKAVSEACQTLCSTIQDSISPAVKKLYVHFPML